MTKTRTALIASLTAVAALAAVGVVARASSAASPAAPTTFSLTLAGTDAHTLDPHTPLMFINGGGVVGILEPAFTGEKYKFAELGLDLPVGAKVTSLSVSGQGCMGGLPVVFGSYSPSTRNTVQQVNMLVPGGCTPKTLTKTVSPAITIAAGRRYVLDASLITLADYPPDGHEDTLFGATVKYTCTSPCVP